MCPLPDRPNSSRKKEAVKFSSLDHPPRAHLLPPAALLSLLCFAFLCLLFVCFRHTEWIIKARKKLSEILHTQLSKMLTYLEEKIRPSGGKIKLSDRQDDDQDQEQASNLTRLSSSSNHHQPQDRELQSFADLSHHFRTQPPNEDNNEDEADLDEDDEVLPIMLNSK